MIKPKAINRKKLVAFVLLILREEISTISRKTKPQTLSELYATKTEAE